MVKQRFLVKGKELLILGLHQIGGIFDRRFFERVSGMPLLKRKPFTLAEPPQHLEPNELVYQVLFTKEIFRNYEEYLNRINLYRNRIWVCKSTGKSNLTYEEALVSEKRAAERLQELPKELVAPALHIIQFSMLSLKDLADIVARNLEERFYVGAEFYGRKDNGVHLCKILKVVQTGNKRTQYEVAWLDKNKKVMENDLLNGENLVKRKLPFSRHILKSFIRESTYRSLPWVLHEKLARKHGISIDPPKQLRSVFFIQNGLVVCKKRKRNEKERKEESRKCERNNVGGDKLEDDQLKEEPIKYPIDDLMVQPGADDPVFSDRPLPSRDFSVPMNCVGDLLMVWDFCSSFSRLLHLWPFSLEDFENAICNKKSNLALIVETHSSLLQLLIKGNGENFLPMKNKRQKITQVNWTEHLCDFLENIKIPEISFNMTTIKQGHYGLLDVNTKLGILKELVNQAFETKVMKEKLDEHIEQRRALGASRREEALEAARKEREEKEKLKVQNGHSSSSTRSNTHLLSKDNYARENGEATEESIGDIISSHLKNQLESKHLNVESKKMAKRQNVDMEVQLANGKQLSLKEVLKRLRDNIKEATEPRSKDQRREYFEREMEKWVIRTNLLGKDRNYNRYWWFRRDGRIFVESSDSKQWGYYSSKEELDALMGSLNCKGEREKTLHKQLKHLYVKISSRFEKRSKNLIEKIAAEEAVRVHISETDKAQIPENEAGDRVTFSGANDRRTPGVTVAGTSVYRPPIYKVYVRKGNVRNEDVVSTPHAANNHILTIRE